MASAASSRRDRCLRRAGQPPAPDAERGEVLLLGTGPAGGIAAPETIPPSTGNHLTLISRYSPARTVCRPTAAHLGKRHDLTARPLRHRRCPRSAEAFAGMREMPVVRRGPCDVGDVRGALGVDTRVPCGVECHGAGSSSNEILISSSVAGDRFSPAQSFVAFHSAGPKPKTWDRRPSARALRTGPCTAASTSSAVGRSHFGEI